MMEAGFLKDEIRSSHILCQMKLWPNHTHTVQPWICTSGYSQREAVLRVAPFPSQEDTVLALVQSHWSVLDRHWEGGLMTDWSGTVSGNRKFIISQVEGEHSTGVCRRPRAEQMPHVCLLLENKGGHWQCIWQQIKSEETSSRVKGAIM